MAEQLLACETVTHAFSSQHYRELPVFGRLSGGSPIIDGVVDLLYRDGDSWVIADYKTDVSADAQTVPEYFNQLRLYAELLDGELDAPITRLELLFPRKQGVVIRTRSLN